MRDPTRSNLASEPQHTLSAVETSGTQSAQGDEIARIVSDVRLRLVTGQPVDETAIVTAHPHLMPALREELRALQAIRQVLATGHRLDPLSGQIMPLSDDLLDRPIEDDTIDDLPHPPRHPIPPAEIPPEPNPVPGFRIVRELPGGGQGVVYEAVQESTGRRVAIKVLPGGPLVASRQRARFDREAEALARLDHPNIVGIIDRGRSRAGSLYLVMPFVEGESLDVYAHRIRRQRNEAATRRLVEVMVNVADAVQAAHQGGIYHRDLKPANVLVDRHGEPRVVDFGLARMDDEGPAARVVTMTGQILGSLPWASPEQVGARNEPLDHRSDIYSMGVMLYQVLTGRFPYPIDGTVTQVITAIAGAPVQPMNDVANDLRTSPALEAVVRKVLEKNPQERYPTAAALAHDLRRYLVGNLPPPPLPVPAAEDTRRWRRGLIALLSMLLLSIALAVGAWWYWSDRTEIAVVELPSFTNSLGMKLVHIPNEMASLGSPSGEPGRDPSENQLNTAPPARVWMSVHEVTREQYERLMGSLPQGAPAVPAEAPVTNLTWDEATAFCETLSKVEGRRYRLPGEIEWELAARAGVRTAYGGTGDLRRMGWFDGNSGGRLQAVGQLHPNHWGLFDMHGNAREWCFDMFAPAMSTSPIGMGTQGASATIRGGSATDPPTRCRNSARSSQARQKRDPHTGFRVVAE